MKMTTEEIISAYDAQVLEEVEIINKKNDKIKLMAEQREKAINRKEKIEEIKKKILEKRKLMKEKTEVDEKVKNTLKEGDDEKFEIEGEEVEPETEEVEDELPEDELPEDEEGTEEDEDEVKESKQEILKKIAERKKLDILKNIKERKEKAEATEKKLEEKKEEKKEKVEETKEPVKEKKEVRVGTLLEAVQGEKKRRFMVYKEEKTHFYVKELGTGKTFRIAKEKVELDNK